MTHTLMGMTFGYSFEGHPFCYLICDLVEIDSARYSYCFVRPVVLCVRSIGHVQRGPRTTLGVRVREIHEKEDWMLCEAAEEL